MYKRLSEAVVKCETKRTRDSLNTILAAPPTDEQVTAGAKKTSDDIMRNFSVVSTSNSSSVSPAPSWTMPAHVQALWDEL